MKKKMMILMLMIIPLFGKSDCECLEHEATYMQLEYEIQKAIRDDKELATRMCAVCSKKIKSYKTEMGNNPMEIKTLETYEKRLHNFCAIKNGLKVDWSK